MIKDLGDALTIKITPEEAAKKPGIKETLRNTIGAMASSFNIPVYQLLKYLAKGLGMTEHGLAKLIGIETPPGETFGEKAAAALERQIASEEDSSRLQMSRCRRGTCRRCLSSKEQSHFLRY